MRFFILINPISGGKAGSGLLRELVQLECLCGGRYADSLVRELDPGNIKAQLEEAVSFDCVVVAGGDGTVSKVIRNAPDGLPKLAIFPLGTGDDLARELGVYGPSMRLSLEEWLGWCEQAQVGKLDVWSMAPASGPGREIRFCNYLSIGFDAAAVMQFHEWRYKVPGVFKLGGKWANRAGYALAGLRCLFGAELGATEIGSTEGQIGTLTKQRGVMFASIRSCMGLGRSNTQSNFSDGKVEALAVGSVLNYAAMLASWLPLPAASLVGSAPSWELRLSQSCPLQADGEPVGALAAGSYRIVKSGSVAVVVGG